jgi:hypothetical protein
MSTKSLKRYRYDGPMSGVTLRDGKASREVMLIPGKEIELPDDNPHVKALAARGHLTEVAAPAAKTKAGKQEEK